MLKIVVFLISGLFLFYVVKQFRLLPFKYIYQLLKMSEVMIY